MSDILQNDSSAMLCLFGFTGVYEYKDNNDDDEKFYTHI